MSDVRVIWPERGSEWVDSVGRRLVVTEVRPSCHLDRNIVGRLMDGGVSRDGLVYVDGWCDYATSKLIFDAIWRRV